MWMTILAPAQVLNLAEDGEKGWKNCQFMWTCGKAGN